MKIFDTRKNLKKMSYVKLVEEKNEAILELNHYKALIEDPGYICSLLEEKMCEKLTYYIDRILEEQENRTTQSDTLSQIQMKQIRRLLDLDEKTLTIDN